MSLTRGMINIEEYVVTAALETILINSSWLFPTSKCESLNGALLNPGNSQDNRHYCVAKRN